MSLTLSYKQRLRRLSGGVPSREQSFHHAARQLERIWLLLCSFTPNSRTLTSTVDDGRPAANAQLMTHTQTTTDRNAHLFSNKDRWSYPPPHTSAQTLQSVLAFHFSSRETFFLFRFNPNPRTHLCTTRSHMYTRSVHCWAHFWWWLITA